MTDYRWFACALLALAGLIFLAGIRLVFAKPAAGHRYTAALAFGTALTYELLQISSTRVSGWRLLTLAALVSASLGLFSWAATTVRKHGLGLALPAGAATATYLETGGPYRSIRHPFYASYLLCLLGGWLVAGVASIGVFVALSGFVYWQAARREEQAFAGGPLAEAYRAYAARTGMFLPRFATMRRSEERQLPGTLS